ncbi:MAG TPA: uroporphyrinogen decarboxylase family protein [Phycisphaerae bacterium]|nr:uroporphyrinogen decarboxylase family protein [Phycisphaerae bacterium]HRR84390.1 uroporphyrinogen decarboxylase family protein [Phycisphaerae bacterium]
MMTSRERILAAIDHREPDRLPIDCGAMRSTGIQAVAYGRLKAYLGVKEGQTRVFDVIQQLAEPEDFYLERFRVDAINAGRDFDPNGWKDWVLPDGSPCQIPRHIDFRPDNGDWVAVDAQGKELARMIAGSTYFSQTHYPFNRDDWPDLLDRIGGCMGEVCWGALAEPIYAGGLSDDNLERIAAHVARLRQTTDKAIMIAFGANLFEWSAYLRRMDNALMDLAAELDKAEALLDKLVETHLAGLDRLLPVLGDNVDLIQLGDDLGMEAGPFFSPELFRKIFKPRYKAIIDRVHTLAPNIRVFLHSCGSIYKLLGDLIEVGVQVINPVQISARDMEPARLKKEFGKDVTFWGGGCDTQKVLPRGTPQEVRDHVRRNIDLLAPGGGFVFTQVHNILSEVPPANIVAMYEEATKS